VAGFIACLSACLSACLGACLSAGWAEAAESDSLVTSAWRSLRAQAYVEAESLAVHWLDARPTVAPDSALYGLAQEIVLRARLETGRWREPGTDAFAVTALRLRDRVLEPLSLDRMRLEAALGRYYRRTAAFDHALLHTQRSLAINEQVFGPDHVECGKAWGNIATLREQMGDLDGAIEADRRVVAIMKAGLPANDPMIAMAEHNLALHYKATGEFALATELLEDALRIRQSQLPADDPKLADILHALAIVRIEAGDLARAHELEGRALAIREAKLSPDDHVLGTSLTTMANVWREEGDFESAMPLYERALAIEEKNFGLDHPELLTELFNLGSAYQLKGRYDRAIELLDRYLAIVREKTPENRAALAEGLAARGGVLRDDEQFAAAERDLRRAASMADSSLGRTHPDLALDHLRLSTLYARTARPDSALAELLRAEEIGRASLALNLRAWPERDALLYARRRPSGRNRAITAVVAQSDSRWVTATWNAVLRSRSMVVDELASRRRVLSSGSARAREILTELQQVAQALSRALVDGPGGDPTRYLARTDSLRNAADRLERDLAVADARAAERVDRYELERADLAAVARSLPNQAALVAYVRYDSIGLDTASDDAAALMGHSDEETHPRYAAFILPAGGGAALTVSLGRATEIDREVARWLQAADPSRDEPGSVEEEIAAGQALRRAIWDPIVASAGTPTDLYLVPDGALEWVNPAALLDDAGEPLALTGPLLHLESTERDLLREGAARSMEGVGLLALGGVDYDATPNARPPSLATNSAAYLFRGQTPKCATFRDLRFAPLPASKREVEQVAAIWKRAAPEDRAAVSRLEGRDATEEQWKRSAPGRRVLHLATHGFFVDPRCVESAAPENRGLGALGSPSEPAGDSRFNAPPAVESPLRLAGFALAGANRRAQAESGQDDGILTAEEIAALDLSTVEVAVLSGCETARGELIASEGVGGLRRAFRTAGASAVVGSVWSVRDEDAALWMERFYLDRLHERRSSAEAARAASLALREQLIALGEAPRVSRWAAFFAIGD